MTCMLDRLPQRTYFRSSILGGLALCLIALEPQLLVGAVAETNLLTLGKDSIRGPAVKPITSFEDRNPFDAGTVVEAHANQGRKALRLDRQYAGMDGPQDWTGYDYLKADLFTEANDPLDLYIEIRDAGTRDYWTRVNYQTVVPPGASTLVLPIKQLYVGEKSRPGRMLQLNAISRLVLNIGEKPGAPLFVDNLRLERDESAQQVHFEGLQAFDFGTGNSPVMEGFTPGKRRSMWTWPTVS